MTENYPPLTTPEWESPPAAPPAANQDTATVVKDKAADVGQSALQAGQHTAEVAREQAQAVTAEAGRQASELVRQAGHEVVQQASQQQQQLAGTLRALGDELTAMAHHPGQHGAASDLARQAGGQAHAAASWLDQREPGHLVQELTAFARRRPGTFVAVAAGAGLLLGRLTRGLAAGTSDQGPDGHNGAAGPALSAMPVSSGTASYQLASTRPPDEPLGAGQLGPAPVGAEPVGSAQYGTEQYGSEQYSPQQHVPEQYSPEQYGTQQYGLAEEAPGNLGPGGSGSTPVSSEPPAATFAEQVSTPPPYPAEMVDDQERVGRGVADGRSGQPGSGGAVPGTEL